MAAPLVSAGCTQRASTSGFAPPRRYRSGSRPGRSGRAGSAARRRASSVVAQEHADGGLVGPEQGLELRERRDVLRHQPKPVEALGARPRTSSCPRGRSSSTRALTKASAWTPTQVRVAAVSTTMPRLAASRMRVRRDMRGRWVAQSSVASSPGTIGRVRGSRPRNASLPMNASTPTNAASFTTSKISSSAASDRAATAPAGPWPRPRPCRRNSGARALHRRSSA